MHTVNVPLKKWAICALGVVALAGVNVSAAAVDPYAPRCGYGYNGCPEGYKCVETSTYASFCQKADYAPDLKYKSKRAPQSTTPGSTFTPVIGVPNKVVERKPIAVLQNNFPDVFNMFVLALESLQARNEATDISYYQVAGIHGYPYVPWQYTPDKTVNPGLGYCTHSSAIFTTWHRPYLILIEQLLYAEAVAIAKKFNGSAAQKYQAAAEQVRMPYWDWASDDTKSRIPQALTATTLTVTKPGPTGATVSTVIQNPLYHYRFANPQPSDSRLGATTVRGSDADTVLFNTFKSRKDSTYQLFSDTTYNRFSSDVENIHNAIHVDVGGDMVRVPTSAFDPIFWLQYVLRKADEQGQFHCNIDRLTAMFQASHPGLTLTPASRSQTFALGGSGPDDLSTPLYPFRHTNGVEWNSNDMKTAESIFTAGYAYPEVPAGKTGEALRIFTTQRANQLYGSSVKTASFQAAAVSSASAPSTRREWSANVLVDSQELPGSQRILIFIGEYDKKNPDSSGGDNANLVGVAGIFAGQDAHVSNNRMLNVSIPLTAALVAKSVNLRPEDVVPVLTDQLHWTVEQTDPTSTSPIPISALKSLKIAVSSHLTTYPADDSSFPVVSDPQTHFEPTKGKQGGLQAGDGPVVGAAAPAVATNGTVVA